MNHYEVPVIPSNTLYLFQNAYGTSVARSAQDLSRALSILDCIHESSVLSLQ
jgi:hypothetical protein